MIKLMLVAGENSDSLAEFLQQRGTFVIDFLYKDLYSNSQQLLNSVIRVDKLVYVYQSHDTNNVDVTFVRREMQVLKGMYESNKFFRADEVILLCSDGKDSKEIREYFTVIMQDYGIEKYSIKILDSIGSFSSIYQNLIGISQTVNFDNQYRNLYRRTKGDDARMAYDPTDDSQSVIEPFNFGNVNAFKERQAMIQEIESPEQFTDSESVKRKTYNKLNLPQIGLIQNKKSIFIITGDQKAGKSHWALQIANSAANTVDNKQRVILLDFSKNQRILNHVRENELAINEVEPFDLLNGRFKDNSASVICSAGGDEFTEIFLKELGTILEQFSVIIVSVEQSDVAIVGEMFRTRKIYSIAVIYQYPENVTSACKYLVGNKILILSTQGCEHSEISADHIKLQHNDITVIKPFKFTTFNNIWLYDKLSKIGDDC